MSPLYIVVVIVVVLSILCLFYGRVFKWFPLHESRSRVSRARDLSMQSPYLSTDHNQSLHYIYTHAHVFFLVFLSSNVGCLVVFFSVCSHSIYVTPKKIVFSGVCVCMNVCVSCIMMAICLMCKFGGLLWVFGCMLQFVCFLFLFLMNCLLIISG